MLKQTVMQNVAPNYELTLSHWVIRSSISANSSRRIDPNIRIMIRGISFAYKDERQVKFSCKKMSQVTLVTAIKNRRVKKQGIRLCELKRMNKMANPKEVKG